MSLAGRPSVRQARLRAVDPDRGTVLVYNPAWPKQHGEMRACHDGTPSIDFACECGSTGHIHQSQVGGAPPHVTEVVVRCTLCGRRIVLDRGFVERGFALAAEAMKPTDGTVE